MGTGAPLLIVAALLSGSAAGWQPENTSVEDEPAIIMWVAANPATCNRRVARHLSFDDFQAQHHALRGICVAVRGWWVGPTLLRNRDDARGIRGGMARELDGERIGVYGMPEMMRGAPSRPRPYTLVGVVGHCDTLAAGTVMVMGYCHYTDGPYIALAEVHSRR